MNVDLKTCHVDPRHIWIADLDYCPYCNHTPQERADAMDKPTRRKTTKKERLTPCQICGYGVSQRHHLLEVSFWDENNATVQLCANCHELYHLMKGSNDEIYLGEIYLRLGIENEDGRGRIWKIRELIEHANNLEKMASKEVVRKAKAIRGED